DEELGRGREREREEREALLSLREAPERHVARDVEAREPSRDPFRVPARVERAEVRLEPREVELRRRVRLLRHDAHARHERGAAPPRALAEEDGLAGARLLEAEETANERRLARAVAAEKRGDRALRDGERDAIEDRPLAVADRERVEAERIRH